MKIKTAVCTTWSLLGQLVERCQMNLHRENLMHMSYAFWSIRRQRTWARLHYAFTYRDMARTDASYCLDRAEWEPE